MTTQIPGHSSPIRHTSGHLSALALSGLVALGALGTACSRHEHPPMTPASSTAERKIPQQEIVEAAARAFTHMRQNVRFAALDAQLPRARGVMIFPNVRKASLLLGGGGGNGVLLVRAADGTWSDPAFYSIGAPSVGLQIGYQEATVVLLIMEDQTLAKILQTDFTLGANTGGGVGHKSEHGAVTGEVVSRPIEQFSEAGGAFVGLSLDGYVTSPRDKHNMAYYGSAVTPREILMDRSVRKDEAQVLHQALAPQPSKAH